MALARGLKSIQNQYSYHFHLIHVNHHLRGKDSNGDEKFVRQLGKKLDWPTKVVQVPVPKKMGNLEEAARDRRYKALFTQAKKLKCSLVLTAHTLDDQAETILMNIFRGSGGDGLAGMWPLRKNKTQGVWLGRPFLNLEKVNLMEYLKKNQWPYRSDRSNDNVEFRRNWLRHVLFPQIEKRIPGFKLKLTQLADIMRSEQDHWKQILGAVRRGVLTVRGLSSDLDFKKLLSYSAAIQRRFLRSEIGGDLLSFDAVEKLRRWMSSSPTNGRHWQLRKGWMVERLSRSQGAPSASNFRFTNTMRRKDK